eukprot:g33750.t2
MADRKAVIKNADMAEDMQQDAIDCATQALEKYNIEKDIAAFIKKDDVEGHPRDQALHLLLPGSGGDLGLQVRLSQDPPRSRFLKNGMSAAQRVKYFYEEQVQRMECLNYETIAFHDVLCQLHDMIGPRVTGEFRLADFKRKRKFAGSFFSIFTSFASEGVMNASLRIEGPNCELVVGACVPSNGGRFGSSTEIILADQVLQVFQKVHILPYKDSVNDH